MLTLVSTDCEGVVVGESSEHSNVIVRGLWLIGGLLAVAVGAIGIVVPGLPTTGFFIVAAACFSKSNKRLERWVLNLPGIGQLVQDYRDGLGMSRRAKTWAITMMVTAAGVSGIFVLDDTTIRAVVGGAVLVGVWYVGWRVPTSERVLAERAASAR